MKLDADSFGDAFTWGVASSAYQTEGAYNIDGKGPSIWDVFTASPAKIYRAQNANKACDFYNRFIQDLILMRYMNIRNFRFSLSWPRIVPDGFGKQNEKGLDFYNRLIDYCLELDIEPWVTLYHWDLPYALERKGGWTNRTIIDWFSRYVEVCVKRYGDRVKNWMVLNEPLVFTGAGYFLGIHAPGEKGLASFLAAAHHAVLCQAEGGRVIRSLQRQATIGTTFSATHIEPFDATQLHTEAAVRVDALANRMFIEPLLGMGYPLQDLKLLSFMEKYIQPADERNMKFDMDFIGIQNYTREVIKYSPFVPLISARIVKADKRKVPVTTMNWEVYPEAIYHLLKKYNRYPGVNKLIVTENGAAFNDVVVEDRVQDAERIQYLQTYLQQVLKARKEGVKVEGYFAWTFTDNFEWAEGFKQRFGLVHVDFTTQKRIIKDSGYWYRRFLEQKVSVKEITGMSKL